MQMILQDGKSVSTRLLADGLLTTLRPLQKVVCSFCRFITLCGLRNLKIQHRTLFVLNIVRTINVSVAVSLNFSLILVAKVLTPTLPAL